MSCFMLWQDQVWLHIHTNIQGSGCAGAHKYIDDRAVQLRSNSSRSVSVIIHCL